MANHYTRQIPDLSGAQRQELQRWVRRSKTAQALVLRARIVLETAAGKSDLQDGCDGLLDEPRPGARRTIGDDDVERVVVQTLQTIPAGATHWSTRSMAKACGHLHFTPTSASWINQVERWFAAITERQIRRGTHRSTDDLESAIEEYLTAHNANPKPFIWTKSADQILESLKIYCERISETAH